MFIQALSSIYTTPILMRRVVRVDKTSCKFYQGSYRWDRSFSSLPLNHSRRVVVSYKRKYVHEVLVNCLFKLAQEKVWLGELTVPP